MESDLHNTNKFYSSSRDIIELYTKIPDYAQVKHLGNSEFINTIEKLKEEFRKIRSSLYEDSVSISDDTSEPKNRQRLVVKRQQVECPRHGTSTTTKPTIIRQPDTSLFIRSCPMHSVPVHYSSQGHEGRSRNRNLDLEKRLQLAYGPLNVTNSSKYDSKTDSAFHDDDDIDNGDLYTSAKTGTLEWSSIHWPKYGYNNRRSPSVSSASSSNNSSVMSSKGTTIGGTGTTISAWSSNPEIYKSRHKEYVPPANIDKRLELRSAKSAPQLYKKDKPDGTGDGFHFKAHPVPDHVHQPLFEKIMLRNKLRSEQVREESKQRLLAQVKPFSFVATQDGGAGKQKGRRPFAHGAGFFDKADMGTNKCVTKAIKTLLPMTPAATTVRPTASHSNQGRQGRYRRGFHYHEEDQDNAVVFRAKPAPPRTRALMAAIRLREQQEYRELKKRLRAEAMMKTSSLPPSMAAREKRQPVSQCKINAILNKLESNASTNTKHHQKNKDHKGNRLRHRRISTSSTEDAPGFTTFTNTDEEDADFADQLELLSDEEYLSRIPFTDASNKPEQKKISRKTHFTPFGSSRFSCKNHGVFESTAVDNNASRLRLQAAKRREQERIKREEEEQFRLQKMEARRQRLRIWHLPAWKHASSYSSTQDISMRCELRLAASILETENFKKDMNNMLSRVQSAPLLLQGVRERKYELCKKHQQELTNDHTSKPYYSPRPSRRSMDLGQGHRSRWVSSSHVGFLDDQSGGGPGDKSETAAICEGSTSINDSESDINTNSENESIKKSYIDLESPAGEKSKNVNESACQQVGESVRGHGKAKAEEHSPAGNHNEKEDVFLDNENWEQKLQNGNVSEHAQSQTVNELDISAQSPTNRIWKARTYFENNFQETKVHVSTPGLEEESEDNNVRSDESIAEEGEERAAATLEDEVAEKECSSIQSVIYLPERESKHSEAKQVTVAEIDERSPENRVEEEVYQESGKSSPREQVEKRISIDFVKETTLDRSTEDKQNKDIANQVDQNVKVEPQETPNKAEEQPEFEEIDDDAFFN